MFLVIFEMIVFQNNVDFATNDSRLIVRKTKIVPWGLVRTEIKYLNKDIDLSKT